ncbi:MULTISPECIES: hypothetical protein [Cyanophyceae]|nr:hypothetical protein [Phormidium sp. FACHB-592]
MNNEPSRYDITESFPSEWVAAAGVVIIVTLGLWYGLRVLGDRP